MESESLAERILQDLGNVFKKEPFVKEFDVVPVSNSSCNRSPVVCVDGHLALGSWCVPHVYSYAYNKLIEARNNITRHEKDVILGWSRVVILINPDVQLAWNIRKELFLCKQTTFQEELKFSQLVLTRKPKCSEVFSHRRWLMQHNLRSYTTDRANNILQEELKVCLMAAEKYRCNYYAWTYRIWLMDTFVHGNPLLHRYHPSFCRVYKANQLHFDCICDTSGWCRLEPICDVIDATEVDISQKWKKSRQSAGKFAQMLESEIQLTREWVRSHVSDCSGFHYRQYLLRRVGSIPLLSKELALCEELCLAFPGHEAIWMHRRFSLWQLHPSPANGETQAKKARGASNWAEAEEAFLQRASGCGEWQDVLVSRHVRWLRSVLGWTGTAP